jgi:hypothetical protein
MQPTTVLLEEDLPREAGDIADVCASIPVVVRLPRPVADAVSREDHLSDHFKSGQRLSLQNRPTGLAVQD